MNAYNTKISRSRLGDIRFPRTDEPANGPVKTYKLSDEELQKYRNGGKEMNGEQAQKAERMANEVNLDEEVEKLKKEVLEASKVNDVIERLEDLLTQYKGLLEEKVTSEQLRYDNSRLEGQTRQLRAKVKETEDWALELTDENTKMRELLKVLL